MSTPSPFSFCKKLEWLELLQETPKYLHFASGIHYHTSSPIFRAKNLARVSSEVYFGHKNGNSRPFLILPKVKIVIIAKRNS